MMSIPSVVYINQLSYLALRLPYDGLPAGSLIGGEGDACEHLRAKRAAHAV